MAAMDNFLITVDGAEHEISPDTLRHLLDTSARFWRRQPKLALARLRRRLRPHHPSPHPDRYHPRRSDAGPKVLGIPAVTFCERDNRVRSLADAVVLVP
jgi:hypothetical protein